MRFYRWTKHRIHNTFVVVDEYLRIMGDKPILDSVEPLLERFYLSSLPHLGVVDSHKLSQAIGISSQDTTG